VQHPCDDGVWVGGGVEVRVWGVGGPKTNVHCAHVPCETSQLHYAQQG
jgi:hypothetical protein